MQRLGTILLRNIVGNNKNVFKNQKRNMYEQFKAGNLKFHEKQQEERNRKADLLTIKDKVKIIKDDIKFGIKEFKRHTINLISVDDKRTRYKDREVIKFWDFNQNNNELLSSYPLYYKIDQYNDLNNWYVTCDSDFDVGYSKANLEISPSGYALFTGNLDTTVPKTGNIVRSGYAYFGSYPNKRQEFFGDQTSEFALLTHFCMRVRGDGRRYFIVFDTSDVLDITWFDRRQYILYTHGGPYWQEVKIPLSKFFFQYKGTVQDEQRKWYPTAIKSVGILITDNFSGSFRLEVDYVGFMRDRQYFHKLDYEGYYHEQTHLKNISSV